MRPQDTELLLAVGALVAFALFAIVMSFIRFNRNPEGRHLDDTHDTQHGTGRTTGNAARPAR